jgi:signal transduction histidine kinase
VPSGAQPVGVSQPDLDVCLDALLNNVLTHTPAGTSFSVAVRPGSRGQWVLVVEDAGPGLPGGALPARGASGGSGTGLGLDIVRRTAEASGGHLSAGRSHEGGTASRRASDRPRTGCDGQDPEDGRVGGESS